GHHTNAPPWLIAPAAVAISQNLRGSFVFVAVVERAHARCRPGHWLPDEVCGPLGAIGGDDYPSPSDGIITQFGQLAGFSGLGIGGPASNDYSVTANGGRPGRSQRTAAFPSRTRQPRQAVWPTDVASSALAPETPRRCPIPRPSPRRCLSNRALRRA